MDNSTTTGTLDQADEDILTDTVSDEALEAVAGMEGGPPSFYIAPGLATGLPSELLLTLAADPRPRRRTKWSNRSP
jgi:hypothetical protein